MEKLTMRLLQLGTMSLLCLGACSNHQEKVSAAWKEAGLDPSDWKDVGAKVAGGNCSQSHVSGLDVTLCEFQDAQAAKKAEAEGLHLVSKAVGASLSAGKTLLVVADNGKEDPSGRRVNTVINAFKKKMR